MLTWYLKWSMLSMIDETHTLRLCGCHPTRVTLETKSLMCWQEQEWTRNVLRLIGNV